VVAVLHGDLIAEESRRAGPRVRDQCLLLRQFQLEVITQELCKALLDVLGFGFWSGEPQEMIVGLCRTPDYAGVE